MSETDGCWRGLVWERVGGGDTDLEQGGYEKDGVRSLVLPRVGNGCVGEFEEPRATSCLRWACILSREAVGGDTSCMRWSVLADALPIGEAAEDSSRHALASARCGT